MTVVGVKICGLKSRAMIDVAIAASADMIGLVIFPKSPRHVDLDAAADLARHAQQASKGATRAVVLLVDPTDELVQAVEQRVHPDIIQLHGHETVERVRAIKAQSATPIIKAFPVAHPDDLRNVHEYANLIEFPVFDAKPPKGSALTGGNGIAFDWELLRAQDVPRPFMLSGGLSPSNVAEAIRIARPAYVDVSSGVEAAPGEKSADLIRAFVRAARI